MGLVFRVKGSGLRVESFGFRVGGLGFMVQVLGWICFWGGEDLGFTVEDSGFNVGDQDSGCHRLVGLARHGVHVPQVVKAYGFPRVRGCILGLSGFD